ncbi:MAG: hypothetical protein OHK0039_16700 [Bacteroidia bacterium]
MPAPICQLRLGFCICIALTATALVGTACFQIRPVEPPSRSVSDWITPTDYEILLQNLRTAIAQGNTQNYLRCFQADSLDFEPVASVFNSNESVWLNWSVQDEQAYFDNVLANLATPGGNSLILIEQDIQGRTADSVRYVGEYTLRINHRDTTLTTLFRGQVQFLMKINTFNEWEIHRWTDIELYPDSTWSKLKLRYSQ